MSVALLRIDDAGPGSPRVTLRVRNGAGWTDEAEEVLSAAAPDDLAGLFDESDAAADAVQQAGNALHDLVIAGKVAAAWSRLSSTEPKPSCLLLEVAGDLAALPWEIMRPPAGLPLATRETPAFARARDFDPDAPVPGECWPLLRALVVVADPTAASVKADEEIAGIREAFVPICGRHDLEVVRGPDLGELRDALEQLRPHILHVIGHGTSEGIVFRDGKTWTPDGIATDLEDHPPRLVVLNACRSATAGASEAQRLTTWRIADALASVQVPAVVGMQGDVSAQAAAAFGGELYRRLALGCPVHVAVAKARKRMGDESVSQLEKFRPVLTLRVPADRVLPPQAPLTQAQAAAIQLSPAFATFTRFVDRTAERRLLAQHLLDDPPQRRGFVVTGDGDSGKSALLKWAVGLAASRGRLAVYVDLDDPDPAPPRSSRSYRALDFLSTVAYAVKAAAPPEAGAEAAFDAWIERVDEIQGPDSPDHGAEGWWRRVLPGSETLLTDVVGAFVDAVVAIAEKARIVLALDAADLVIEPEWREYVQPGLLDRLLQLDVPVTVLVALPTHARDRVGTTFGRLAVPLALTYAPQEEWDPLSREFLRAQRYRPESFEPLLPVLAPTTPWLPGPFFRALMSAARAQNWPQEAA